MPKKMLNLKCCGCWVLVAWGFFCVCVFCVGVFLIGIFKAESKYVVGKTVHNMDMENSDCLQWHKV